MPGHARRPLRRRLLALYLALHRRFGPQRWWPGRSRLEVAIGAVLTQHTAWTGAERAIANLRAAGALSVDGLHALPRARLRRLIRPAGTYRVKARRLRAFLGFLRARAGGRVAALGRQPLGPLRAALLEVPGIGPETADSILLYAATRPVFVVDAYTRRVLARHRIVPPRIRYAALRAVLEGHLPSDPRLFNEYHALLVAVGKAHCRARPRCEGCPLRFDLSGRPPRG
jgi:endonuclease-3 related protein